LPSSLFPHPSPVHCCTRSSVRLHLPRNPTPPTHPPTLAGEEVCGVDGAQLQAHQHLALAGLGHGALRHRHCLLRVLQVVLVHLSEVKSRASGCKEGEGVVEHTSQRTKQQAAAGGWVSGRRVAGVARRW
jgi:hypothetical protein